MAKRLVMGTQEWCDEQARIKAANDKEFNDAVDKWFREVMDKVVFALPKVLKKYED